MADRKKAMPDAGSGGTGWPGASVTMRRVADLVPYARNARTHSDEQVAQVARAIQEFGWTTPVLVRAEDAQVIAGHGRLLAAAQLGIESVPVMEARGWSDAQVRAYVIADNKMALNAGWDEKLLAAELKDLEGLGYDIGVIGFSDDELLGLDPSKKRGLTDPDDAPDLQDNAVSKVGMVWQLGGHRVACGNSTNPDAVDAVMAEGMADACWTDPPYNVAVEKWGRRGIENDKGLSDDDFRDFLQDAFAQAIRILKPGSPMYVAHAHSHAPVFQLAFVGAGMKFSAPLVWAKETFVVARQDYQWQHEAILYGWKPGAAHRWYGNRKQSSVLSLEGNVFVQNEDGTVTVRVGDRSLIISGTDLQARPVEPSVLHCPRPKKSPEHPTMKPVELIARMLRNSTREGDVVLDLFGGSGSTLICCETMGRVARLVELDPRFVDVIVKRWQEFTGRAATLDGDGRTFAEVAAAKGGPGA